MPRPTLFVLVALISLAPHLSASAQEHTVSQETSPRLHLTGDVGFTAAFAENLALPTLSIDGRIYSTEGFGLLLRIGYEGLVYLNFGAIDLAFAFRHELPGDRWAGFGLSAAIGLSGMIRDSVYHFTGDDVGFALFGTAGLDVRLGRMIIGVDAIGRWQLGAVSLLGPQTRGSDWTELGAVIRVGGEVLL